MKAIRGPSMTIQMSDTVLNEQKLICACQASPLANGKLFLLFSPGVTLPGMR